MSINSTKLYRRPEVEYLTGLSRSSIYALMEQGKFPKQIKLGERSVAWSSEEVNEWIKSRIAASREGGAI